MNTLEVSVLSYRFEGSRSQSQMLKFKYKFTLTWTVLGASGEMPQACT